MKEKNNSKSFLTKLLNKLWYVFEPILLDSLIYVFLNVVAAIVTRFNGLFSDNQLKTILIIRQYALIGALFLLFLHALAILVIRIRHDIPVEAADNIVDLKKLQKLKRLNNIKNRQLRRLMKLGYRKKKKPINKSTP